MKKIAILFLLTISFIATAQIKYDTISFDQVTINNSSLYTKFIKINKYIDDTKTKAKVHNSSDVELPFIKKITNSDVIYEVMTDSIGFFYSEDQPEKVYIYFAKPTKNFKIKLGSNIKLTKNTKVTSLKYLFKNSYKTYLDSGKIKLRLLIKNETEIAFIDLFFKNQSFSEIYLSK